MINNEYIPTQQNSLLLQQKQFLIHWLHFEATNFNQNSLSYVVKSYSDVFKSKIIYRLLLKINFQYFTKTQIGQFVFQDKEKDHKNLQIASQYAKKENIVKLIETYLEQIQCKKFSKQYKIILQNCLENEDRKNQIALNIIKLILYMAIKSQNKNQFIQRIFSFNDEYQNSLMHQIMQLQTNLQNITQIQEIVNKYNELQAQNINLKNRLTEAQKYNKRINKISEQQNICTYNLEEVMSAINREKMSVFLKLDFKDGNNYLKNYGNLLFRYQKATKMCQKKEVQQSQLYENHIQLSNKRHNFEEVLQHLTDQKEKLQKKYKQKKDESFNLSRRFSIKLSKQNNNQPSRNTFSGRYSKKYLDGDSTLISNGSLNNSINMSFRVGNNSMNQSIDLATKLEQMIIEQEKMKDQLQTLKFQNKFLKKKEKKQSKILNQFKQVFLEFSHYANSPTFFCQKIRF